MKTRRPHFRKVWPESLYLLPAPSRLFFLQKLENCWNYSSCGSLRTVGMAVRDGARIWMCSVSMSWSPGEESGRISYGLPCLQLWHRCFVLPQSFPLFSFFWGPICFCPLRVPCWFDLLTFQVSFCIWRSPASSQTHLCLGLVTRVLVTQLEVSSQFPELGRDALLQ